MIFRKSLLCLEKEKLYILSKELNYRALICDFYDMYKSNEKSEKKDLEHSFRMLKYQIIELKESIENNFETLSENIKRLDGKKYPVSFEIESLIYLDMIREYIKYIVNRADTINTKISQLLRDGYNQYLPKPITGKRYSNVNITSQVEYSLKNKLTKLLGKNNIETMVIWDYDDDYKINEYNIKKNNIEEQHEVFKLSYWYFELPYFLPNLTHEIGHILQKHKDFLNPKELETLLKKELKNYLQRDNSLEENLNNFSENASKEIFSDIVSFLYHGNSYIYSMTHKQLAEGLSKNFKAKDNRSYDSKHRIKDTQYIKNLNNAFAISPMRFNIKRDLIFIRLYVLLNIRDIIEEEIDYFSRNINNKMLKRKFEFEQDNEICNLKRLLNSIYNVDNEKNITCLENYYSYYYNYSDLYNASLATIKKSIIVIMDYFKNNPDILLNILNLEKHKIKDSKHESLPTFFNTIWQKRFNSLKNNKILHRYIFRKKLHRLLLEQLIENYEIKCKKNIFQKIFKKIKNKKEPIPFVESSEIEPYSMVFIKFRLEQITEIMDIKSIALNKEAETDNIKSQGKVLGMYDYMYIRKLDEEYTINKIYKPRKYFNSNNYDKKNLKYYESYYSLMKIMSDKKGKLDIDFNQIIWINEKIELTLKNFNYQYGVLLNKFNILSATIQIEVYKNLSSGTSDIYNNLYENLKFINSVLCKIDKKTYKKIEIFKSLGPKDIIIHIDRATVDTIYDLKKEFYNKFNRTYTTLYLNSYNLCFKDTNYYFVSKLRMSSGFTIKKFRKIYEKENNIFTISLKTGVMDYVIVWKSDSKLEDIVDFYNQLLNEKLVYDIQTSIEEKLATN